MPRRARHGPSPFSLLALNALNAADPPISRIFCLHVCSFRVPFSFSHSCLVLFLDYFLNHFETDRDRFSRLAGTTRQGTYRCTTDNYKKNPRSNFESQVATNQVIAIQPVHRNVDCRLRCLALPSVPSTELTV